MIEKWVKDMVEDVCGKGKLEKGTVVKHPSGRMVKITGGAYWGTHGGSNFWYWREVMADGSLGKEECGYGWV